MSNFSQSGNLSYDGELLCAYTSSNMTVIATKRPLAILPDHAHHSNYEFILPFSNLEGIAINRKALTISEGYLYPIISGSTHGAEEIILDAELISIHFPKFFFENLLATYFHDDSRFLANVSIEYDEEVEAILHSFIEECYLKREGDSLVTDALSKQLAIALIRKAKKSNAPNKARADIKRLNKTINYFSASYAGDCLEAELTKAIPENKYISIKRIKDYTGKTPNRCCIDLKIMLALEYLRRPDIKVVDVGAMCGFENHSYFSKVFKQKTGLSPRDFKNRLPK